MSPFPAVSDPSIDAKRQALLQTYQILDTPRDLVFDRFVFTAAQLFHVPVSGIGLLDHDRHWFKAQVGNLLQQTQRDIAFCTLTVQNDGVLVIPDASKDPRTVDNPLVTGSPYIRFYAGAPLIAAPGLHIGALCVVDFQPRSPTARQTAQLRELAASVVRAMEIRKTRLLCRQAEDQTTPS